MVGGEHEIINDINETKVNLMIKSMAEGVLVKATLGLEGIENLGARGKDGFWLEARERIKDMWKAEIRGARGIIDLYPDYR